MVLAEESVCPPFSTPLGDAALWQPPHAPAVVVSNPPWDGRIEGAVESWASLSKFLRREAAPSRAYTLSGNADVTRELRMKASTRHRIVSGGVDLRWLKYQVLPPKKRVEGGWGGGEGAATPRPHGGKATEVVARAAPGEEITATAGFELALTAAGPDVEPPAAASRASLEAMVIPQLKEILRENGAKVGGKKAELVERILALP